MAAAYANSVIRILNFRTFKTCLVMKGLQRKPAKTESKLQKSTFAFCQVVQERCRDDQTNFTFVHVCQDHVSFQMIFI